MNPKELVPLGSSGVMVSRLGLGGSSLGGMYREASDHEAMSVVAKLFDLGLNYIDTAPLYGTGMSEKRFGQALAERPRDSYVISSKVSELVITERPMSRKSIFSGTNRELVKDYSRDGTLRSIDGSLERLGVENIDIIFIHDAYKQYTDQAIAETYPTLMELKSQGAVKALGVGMGDCEIMSRFAREGEFDCFLLWGRYSLLNQEALHDLLPLCVEKNIGIVMGAPYESGILASDLSKPENLRYRYREVPPDVLERARRIDAVCKRYEIPLKAAAIQFIFGHPAVVTVIPGTRSHERLQESYTMMQVPIPEDLWSELKSEHLIPADAPTPPIAEPEKE